MAEAPTFETERLVLRPMTMKHWPAYRDLMQTHRSVYMGGPFAPRDAWGMFCHDHAQWSLMGHGALMLEDRDTRICLGQVGINHGPLFPEHELGWFLYPQAEGRGYAYEAAAFLKDWAQHERGLPALVSYIDEPNIRSRKLAERLGAALDHDAPRSDPQDLVYRHF